MCPKPRHRERERVSDDTKWMLSVKKRLQIAWLVVINEDFEKLIKGRPK